MNFYFFLLAQGFEVVPDIWGIINIIFNCNIMIVMWKMKS